MTIDYKKKYLKYKKKYLMMKGGEPTNSSVVSQEEGEWKDHKRKILTLDENELSERLDQFLEKLTRDDEDKKLKKYMPHGSNPFLQEWKNKKKKFKEVLPPNI